MIIMIKVQYVNLIKVLIIGGEDGGVAREILKHSTIEKVVMVEIDEVSSFTYTR